MRTRIFWIAGIVPVRLAIMPRPSGGKWLADEVAGWHEAGIGMIVSLVEPEEARELGLGEEAVLCRNLGIDFLSLPIPDRGVPEQQSETVQFVDNVAAACRGGVPVAVHCQAGIGRSGLIAACVLVRLGHRAAAATETISRSRGLALPETDEQRQWLERFAAAHRPA